MTQRSVRIPDDLDGELVAFAASEDRPVVSVIRLAIQSYLAGRSSGGPVTYPTVATSSSLDRPVQRSTNLPKPPSQPQVRRLDK